MKRKEKDKDVQYIPENQALGQIVYVSKTDTLY